MLSTSCNDRNILIRASSAHRYVVKMDRRRVVMVSGMSYGESILSIENIGWVLWVFHFLWIESDYKFYSGFHNEMHKYFVYSFSLHATVMSCYGQVAFFFFLPARKKASYAELYFCM